MSVVVRFAPSPTGYLHIGGARTALFNWLYARRHGGKFLLRVEDTDQSRNNDAAIQKIYDSLRWLGCDWDEDPVMQSSRQARHVEVAQELLKNGKAYYCYASPEELETMRTDAMKNGHKRLYNGLWRDRDASDAPKDIKPVIRIKTPLEGETTVNDHVQGTVTTQNADIDDYVILRSDGTPTYLLSVVVDDHDMGITHVIRGDDHLTNTFRQIQIFKAMDWPLPEFAHIPLIYGPDGKKMSKRHGATATDDYQHMGYLPEAMRNYLLRLGWSHGDDEIITTQQAIEWFDLDHVGKSPSRFDFDKLNNINAHYLRALSEDELMAACQPFLPDDLDTAATARFTALLPELKQRINNLKNLIDISGFIFNPLAQDLDADAKTLLDAETTQHILNIKDEFLSINNWNIEEIKEKIQNYIKQNDLKMGKILKPLRAALTGSAATPGGIFEIIHAFGKEIVEKRLSL